jgi:transposase
MEERQRKNVAGLDMGSERRRVCAPTVDGTGREIAEFGSVTPEVIRMAGWLKERHVESVALEIKGDYWEATLNILEDQGLKVWLVDPQELARVRGRDNKRDPTQCEWIQRLHSSEALPGSYPPPISIRMLRRLEEERDVYVAKAAELVRDMQEALEEMKMPLDLPASDLDTATTISVVRAIVAGKPDRKGGADLFILRQKLRTYDMLAEHVAEFDQEIHRHLAEMNPE